MCLRIFHMQDHVFRKELVFLFPSWMPFIVFSRLSGVARTCGAVLSRNGSVDILVLFLLLEGKHPVFHHKGDLDLGLSWPRVAAFGSSSSQAGTCAELWDPGCRAGVGSEPLIRQKGRTLAPLIQARCIWCPHLSLCWREPSQLTFPSWFTGTLSPQ